MRRSPIKGCRAFTLFEVLIAISLMLALVGAMFGFFFDMLRSRERVLTHVRQQDAVAAAIRQLDADLTACVVGDAKSGAGVRGDAESLHILSRGVAGSLAQRGGDDPYAFGDLQFTDYRFDYENAAIEMTRGPAGRGGLSLSRHEWLDGPVYRLRFRYSDGREWRDSFDSLSEGRLPAAVEVAIWLTPPPDGVDAVEESPKPAGGQEDAASEPASKPATTKPRDDREQPSRSPEDVPPDRTRVFLIPDAADGSSLTPEPQS